MLRTSYRGWVCVFLFIYKLMDEVQDFSVGEVVNRCAVADRASHLSGLFWIGSDVRSRALPTVRVCGFQSVFLHSKFDYKSWGRKSSVPTFSALRFDVVSSHPKTKASRTSRN